MRRSDADLNERIGKARAAYLQLKNIWSSKQLSTNTKVKIFNTNSKTVLLCGVETCKITKSRHPEDKSVYKQLSTELPSDPLTGHYQQQPAV
ncbi:unnamed protein product [Schistosoma margrebowiei]|uniref:Uncharacterized protein n=1 Tax=Schistosoma margrebowiei TaxID=48269 RepID=A0A183MQX5_9TREM|nr:unnamed protein product [Schistosoma margrebowiei]